MTACAKCGAKSCDGYAAGCDVRTLQRELREVRAERDDLQGYGTIYSRGAGVRLH